MKKICSIALFTILTLAGVILPFGGIGKRGAEAFQSGAVNRRASAPQTEELGLSSRSSILIDAANGKVLYEKNADEKLGVASMTKTMTLLLTFEARDRGIVSFDDMVTISDYAASQEGSECFLDAGHSYRLFDLIGAVVIASANDACVAIAEYVAGSDELFATRMNERAVGLGLSNTNFKNSTGLHENGHYSTAHDIAVIMRELIKHQEYMQLSTIWMDQLKHEKNRTTELVNTNRLIKSYKECDAGKTGFTDEARYCLVATARRGATRLIACVMGLNNSKDRFEEAVKLFNFGFSNFESRTIVDSKTPLAEIKIKKSKVKRLPVFVDGDVNSTVRKSENTNVTTKLNLAEDYIAPITKGQKVGEIEVYDNNVEIDRRDVVTRDDAPKRSYKESFGDVTSSFRGI